MNLNFTRRRLLLAAVTTGGLLALQGCATTAGDPATAKAPKKSPEPDPNYVTMYGPMPEEDFPIPAIDLKKVPAKYYRSVVDDPTGERPGTIVVDTAKYYLYLVMEGGQAMRYGVGLGRQGFTWSGDGVIQYKRRWPRWTPPDEMVARQPELEKYSIRNGGQPPGLDNPLGARALYIFQNGEDTLYRIHGSPEYWTIGKSVSSGCVRMINQDVIDLFGRVTAGSKIIVRGAATS